MEVKCSTCEEWFDACNNKIAIETYWCPYCERITDSNFDDLEYRDAHDIS